MYSKIYDRNFDVDFYDVNQEKGLFGVTYQSLQEIVENELQHVDVNVDVIKNEANYASVSCTVYDVNRDRKITRLADVNTDNLDKSSPNYNFTRQHPLSIAYQTAVSLAVKALVGWGDNFTKDDIGIKTNDTDFTTENSVNETLSVDLEQSIPDMTAIYEKVEASAKEKIENPDISDDDTNKATVDPSMFSEDNLKDVENKLYKDGFNVALNQPETVEDELKRLETMMCPKNSKHKNDTFKDTYEKDKRWTDWIYKNSKSDIYNDFKRYIELRNAQ